MNKYSFWRGWEQLRIKDKDKAKKQLIDALGISLQSRQVFINRRNGTVIPKMDQKEKIEKIFHSYGIKRIWGGKS